MPGADKLIHMTLGRGGSMMPGKVIDGRGRAVDNEAEPKADGNREERRAWARKYGKGK